MTTRPSSSSSARSSSIPIPRTLPPISPSRNLETLIPIPFGPASASGSRAPPGSSSRSNYQNGSRVSLPSHGPSSGSFDARGLALPPPTISSSSPARPTWGAYHITQQQRGQPFEPRRVHAVQNPEAPRPPVDPGCSTSPTRIRRSSGALGFRSLNIHRHMAGVPAVGSNSAPVLGIPSATGVVSVSSSSQFPRPTYLEHSALRHLLQTEAPPSLPPSRKVDTRPNTYVASPSPIDSDDESNTTPPPARQPTYQLSMHDPLFKLPTRWSETVKNSNLNVSSDGRELSFIGVSCSGDKDASARTNHPIPAACGVYYFEIQVTGKAPKSHLTIGFAGSDMKTNRGPGFDGNSWGYSAFDGCSYAGDKIGTTFGNPFTVGDIIGCGIDFTSHKAFFTKNGTLIGHTFEGVGKNVPLHPAVGMRNNGEAVRVNFGHEPFRYDIDYHVQQQRNATWQKILSTQLDSSILERRSAGCALASSNGGHAMEGIKQEPADTADPPTPLTEEQTKGAINRLVLSYLMHHGYAKTARAFKDHISSRTSGSSTEQPPTTAVKLEPSSTMPDLHSSSITEGDASTADVDMDGLPTRTAIDESEADLELRTRLVGYVSSGNIDVAISETRECYPTALDADGGMMLFKLRCRKFVELILEAAELRKNVKARAAERMEGVIGTGGSIDSIGAQRSDNGGINEEKEEAEAAAIAVGSVEDGMGMDVDDDSALAGNGFVSGMTTTATIPIPPSRRSPVATGAFSPSGIHSVSTSDSNTGGITSSRPRRRDSNIAGMDDPETLQYEQALQQAIDYGQELLKDYGHDMRPEVKAIYNKTFGILAWEDPLEADGPVVEVVGKQARYALADQLNQAIMKSQGRPAHPALEMLYRHTAACIMQLGRVGVGAAAFADMSREFFEN